LGVFCGFTKEISSSSIHFLAGEGKEVKELRTTPRDRLLTEEESAVEETDYGRVKVSLQDTTSRGFGIV